MKCGVLPLIALLAWPSAGLAEFVLQLPLGAKATYSQAETALPPMVPIGPFENGQVPKEKAPENIHRTVWAMGAERTLGEVQSGIVDQLESAGYEVLMFCVTAECGGFDFRFGIDVVDEPAMWVDLRDFRFISAVQTVLENPAYVTFLLSRSPVSVFVQMTEYRPEKGVPQKVVVQEAPTVAGTEPESAVAPVVDLGSEISIVLEGLTFETGSSRVGDDPNGMIEALANKMKGEPDLKVLLVGHSDMSGSLQGNISVSTRRAESVRQSLIKDHGIQRGRITSHGVGFLAPRADNGTEAGRQKNRRVEAVFSR